MRSGTIAASGGGGVAEFDVVPFNFTPFTFTTALVLPLLIIYTVKPLNTADLGTGKKAAVFRKRQYWESYITYKTLIWVLEIDGGIGRAALSGGAVLRC